MVSTTRRISNPLAIRVVFGSVAFSPMRVFIVSSTPTAWTKSKNVKSEKMMLILFGMHMINAHYEKNRKKKFLQFLFCHSPSVKLTSLTMEFKSKNGFQTSVNRMARFHSNSACPSASHSKDPSAKTPSSFAIDE